MDWPTRTLRSRIAWFCTGVRIRRTKRRRGTAAWWTEFEGAFRAYVDQRTEALHRLERKGRAPLYVLVVRDRAGQVLETATCDPEDY
jgi:hypothetical protein